MGMVGRLARAAARFLRLLPAFVLAFAWLRAAEFIAGWPAGIAADAAAWGLARALADDLLGLLRVLPILLFVSLPALLAHSRRVLLPGVGITWSALVLTQACLVQYFIATRVPLGADLYTYSVAEIRAAAFAGLHLNPWVALGTPLALATLWRVLAANTRDARRDPAPRATAILCALGLVLLWFGPAELPPARGETEYARSLRLSKMPSFIDGSLAFLRRVEPVSAPTPALSASTTGDAVAGADVAAGTTGGKPPADARYPFLHPERTPDVLGASFDVDPANRPNLVFLIVEGLGRSFSGPEAPLGSFTPYLDQLAERSLYWDNFLAPQGRTFGVLPSLFGSLPFADQGFAALGQRMPEHATLLSVLKAQGYRLRYFGGTDAAFDDERTFLEHQGVDVLFDRASFGPAYERTNEWGYDDRELLSLALSEEARDERQPFVEVIQTITMHDPYRFLGEAPYRARVEDRLDQLGIAEAQRAAYRASRDIYAAILYTDDALRHYFDEASRRPTYRNTIFVVTGDHRLPELPLAEWIDRYHVPLLVYSPLLKAPRRIRSVSSHFDVAPSLLAFLAHGYGVRTPASVTWLGSGLDLEPSFRNLHEIPMKQTKANLADFVSGQWFLSRGALYRLRDGLHAEPSADIDAKARTEARFIAFRRANAVLARSLVLAPPGTPARSVSYAERPHASPTLDSVAAGDGLAVREAHTPERARLGELAIEVVFANSAREPSELFVPLVVLTGADGAELSESYGSATTLAAGEAATLHLRVRTDGVPPGRHYLSVYPSDPGSGRRIGDGRFRIPVVIEAPAASGALP
jgi:uncharacterized sulfatase